jgi:hypothetical protein
VVDHSPRAISLIQYFRIVHNLPTQRQTLLQQIATSLHLHFPIALDSPLAPSSNLFNQAVDALVTSLRTSPFPIWSVTDPLLHTLRERYYSPIFGRSLEEYRYTVYYHSTQ